MINLSIFSLLDLKMNNIKKHSCSSAINQWGYIRIAIIEKKAFLCLMMKSAMCERGGIYINNKKISNKITRVARNTLNNIKYKPSSLSKLAESDAKSTQNSETCKTVG